MVSIIIPARFERFLDKTILDIYEKAWGEVEIIVIYDGYQDKLLDGPVYIYNETSRGMRTAINQGVGVASGKYIMKLDAHCMLDKGFDIKLVKEHRDDWVQVPRRKRLEPRSWTLKDVPDVDYMYIGRDYKGVVNGSANRDGGLKKRPLDDIEVFQGSCYFMTRDYFKELGLLDDINFGGSGYEAQEIALKCRYHGGRVMRNKKTWYAHARIGRMYSRKNTTIDKSRKYIKKFVKKYGR